MKEPIRCEIVEVDFSPEDRDGMQITLRFWDQSQRVRHGHYLLIEADHNYEPAIPVAGVHGPK